MVFQGILLECGSGELLLVILIKINPDFVGDELLCLLLLALAKSCEVLTIVVHELTNMLMVY